MSWQSLSRCLAAAVVACVVSLGQPASAAAAGDSSRDSSRPWPGLSPSTNERRAVRGRPPLEPTETAELATLRRFEESLPSALPDPVVAAPAPAPAAPASAAAAPRTEPAELAGAWGGTGDEAPAARPAAIAPGGLVGLYVDFFTADPAGRAVAQAWLERVSSWQRSCAGALEGAGVPTQLLLAAVAATGFDVEARGRGGYVGPWLLRPEQARAQGLKVGFWQDERRDPVRSSQAAAAVLKDAFDRFGTWPLALVAFHLGPEFAQQAEAPVPSLPPSGSDSLGGEPSPQLGRPARLFLARLAALTQLAASREAAAGKGRQPRAEFTSIDVPSAITLETIARVIGVDLPRLRALNPALLRDRVAPDPGATVRVPAGTRTVALDSFETARGPLDRVRIEGLRLGESAEALALARQIPPAEMKRLHGLRDLADLRGPMDVLLPLAPDGQASAPAPGSAEEMPDELPLVAVPARRFDLPDRARLFYFVADGDTLAEIAAAVDVAPADIVSWNNLDPNARLQAKMVLQLFLRPDIDRKGIALVDASAVRAVEVGSEEFHALEVATRGKTRVLYAARAGDTLPKIARRYGLGAPDLARINRMSWNAALADGQRIVVYAPSAIASSGAGRESAAGRASAPKRREAPAATPVRKLPGPSARPGASAPARPGAKAAGKPISARATRPAPRR